jgi:hypothetical protein
MKTLTAICLSLVLAALLVGASSFAMAAYWSEPPHLRSAAPDLVVKVEKKKQNKNGNNDGGNGATQQVASDAADGGDHVCPSGYVVLDKPNKYGNYCEPREGVCAKGMIGTPPNCACPEGTLPLGPVDQPCVAKVACPFPGQVGNAPNCECPKGTEFIGYKGCKKVTVNTTCDNVDYPDGIEPYFAKCKAMGGTAEAAPISRVFGPGEKPYATECCTIKYYEK